MTPSLLLFSSSVMMGTLVSMSSSNWLYLWMGMELNLLSFIPIMAHSHKLQETMGSIKYFMIQAIGSGLMLTAGVVSMNPHATSNQNITSCMFIMSMCLKLGTAPYHQWLPHVMASLPWSTCLLLATWQKISPLVMLMFITPSKMMYMVLITAALSAIVGGTGGLNQSQMRALMAYSSIGHMGWMLAALSLSNKMSIIYFSVYVLITSSLMVMFMKTNTMMSQMSNSVIPSKIVLFYLIILMFLSLGGLPPFLGFIPKWLVIFMLTEENMVGVLIMLITGSVINLFYYFTMMFNFMLTPQQNLLTQMPPLWPAVLTSAVTVAPVLTLL
uniref:NADH dehydrogenase subunit 2 n=1 Tax=Nereis pelagica TaxID=194549 RepID=UPI003002CD7F|nr:NADH dehydrogenase subunit 2 [Nereis pelagica]